LRVKPFLISRGIAAIVWGDDGEPHQIQYTQEYEARKKEIRAADEARRIAAGKLPWEWKYIS
jgi:hypothetical protein